MNNKAILYTIISLCVIASAIARGFDSYSSIGDRLASGEIFSSAPTTYDSGAQLYEEGDDREHIALNRRLDNAMSALDQTRSFDREIESFMRRWELNGASIAIMRNDSLIYAKGYGNANDSVKCEVSNVFRIASASKLITAAAIMKLVEQGQLSLSRQVFGEMGILSEEKFLDLYSSNLEKITVEHLLRHTAGFSSPHGDPAFSGQNVARFLGKELPLTLDDMVVYATRNRLKYRPGGSYDYSNLGYIILTKIIESVSGQGYEEYVQENLLHAAGCYDMYIGRNFKENRADNEVDYYEVKEASPVEAYNGTGRLTMKSNGGNNVTLLGGAGGWVASPTELLRFVAAINGNPAKEDILSRRSVEIMTEHSEDQHPIGWASTNGGNWLRSGSMAGTSALIKHQSDGYTWIFVANKSAWIGHRLSSYISSHITRAMGRVTQWPERDLFATEVD